MAHLSSAHIRLLERKRCFLKIDFGLKLDDVFCN